MILVSLDIMNIILEDNAKPVVDLVRKIALGLKDQLEQ